MRPRLSRSGIAIHERLVRWGRPDEGSHRLAHIAVRSLAAGALLGVSACGPAFDPLTREGLWRPDDHVNHSNLVVMVANPADLVRGTGTTTADGQLATVAVERLRQDKVKKLPASDIAALSAGNSGDNSAAGAATGP